MSRQSRERRARAARTVPVATAVQPRRGTVSQRPRPPWHPVPVGELLMLIGLVMIVVGLAIAGPRGRGPDLAVGVGSMALGVIELTLREHLTGYRKHRALLAALTAVAVHMLTVAFLPIRYVGLPALAADIAVFAASFFAYGRLWRRASDRRAGANAVAAMPGVRAVRR